MKRVLVTEDDDAIRENILDLLEAEGYAVATANNGPAGVQLAHDNRPDLIICDIMMPDLDGYGVLDELRKDPATATIPFIFLTAKADKSDMRRGMELGADDYVTKPFTRDELIKAIETRLAKQETVSREFEKKLDQLRGSITLSLPHELRTPLSGILTGSTLLEDGYESMDRQDIYEMAKIMRESAERLNRLIMNYLLYAELELVARDAEIVQALRTSHIGDAKPLVVDSAARAAEQARRQSDLKLDMREAAAHIAEPHLKKIAEELLDNAFKYSKPGAPVHITGGSDDNTFRLSITDHGRGMTAEQIADIGAYMQFERKIHEQQGSGLGLTIAKRLAELYDGELTIESQPGRQTTVRVRLPA